MFSADVSGGADTAMREPEGDGGGEVELDFQNGKEILSFKQILSWIIAYHVPALETSILELGNKLGEVVVKVQINQLMQSIVR